MATILVVSKDQQIKSFIKTNLLKLGYNVKSAENGSQAFLALADHEPDLVVLDKNITDIRNESICWQIKRDYPYTPLLLLVDDMEQQHILRLYKAGADDFVTYPIDTQDLISRINIHLTNRRDQPSNFQIDDLVVDVDNYSVSRDGKPIVLTPQEFKLLKFMVLNKGKVLTRDTILARVWSYDTDVESRVVDVYVGYLRKKIDKGRSEKLIQTVRGFGYTIKEAN